MGRPVDELRRRRVVAALAEADRDVVACALPANVLMLTGYRPVVGDALALASREGRLAMIAPEDEVDLARAGWADDVRTFRPGSLDALRRSTSTAIAACATATSWPSRATAWSSPRRSRTPSNRCSCARGSTDRPAIRSRGEGYRP